MKAISNMKYFEDVGDYLRNIEIKGNLLDVGATDGGLKEHLDKSINYFSLDIKNFNKDRPNNYLVNLDTDKIPVEDNTFDVIVCLETLEHLLYPNKVMKELLRVGKEDCIFIISMPNEFNLWARILFLFGKMQKSQEPFKVQEHNHIHKPRVKDIINFCRNYFKIINVEFVWYSRKNHLLDWLFNSLCSIIPNLFARNVIVYGRRK